MPLISLRLKNMLCFSKKTVQTTWIFRTLTTRRLKWSLAESEAECRAGRRCSSNSAILRTRPGNCLRRNRRALHASEAIFLSLSILRHDTYFRKASTRTLHDMQHHNRSSAFFLSKDATCLRHDHALWWSFWYFYFQSASVTFALLDLKIPNIYNWQSASEFQSWLLLRYSSESMILAG